MGVSIVKTIRLANLLRDALKNSISIAVRTGTVQVRSECNNSSL